MIGSQLSSQQVAEMLAADICDMSRNGLTAEEIERYVDSFIPEAISALVARILKARESSA